MYREKTVSSIIFTAAFLLAVSSGGANRVAEEVERCRARVTEVEQQIEEAVTHPQFSGWLHEQCAAVRGQIETAAAETADSWGVKGLKALREGVIPLDARLDRLAALPEFFNACRAAGCPDEYGVGFATGMEKVLPRALPLPARPGPAVTVSLARNEYEAFQVVVVPWEGDLRDVTVSPDELQTAGGAVLSASAIDVWPVGFVRTEMPSMYTVEHAGWWPDPLLDFMAAADVKKGDAQAFWLRVHAGRDQKPGLYRGTVRIDAAAAPAWTFELEVQVRDFTLPDHSLLPTAMSVTEKYIENYNPDTDTIRRQYADFLADYLIDYDDIYRRGAPDFGILQRLEARDELVAYNLGMFHEKEFAPGMDDAAFREAMDGVLARLRPAWEAAGEAGLRDKAYIYGFDECPEQWFDLLQRIAEEFHAACPGVPVITTAYDHSFGLDSAATAIDGWIPLTPRYDPAQVEKARKAGKQVWWYICCGPVHPYANFFVEYPAIETRLLMGAMAVKYRPDGFLYYRITRWPGNEAPITDGPFTGWNPASFRDYNGDGSLLCAGPGGKPLATIRLENIRDGLEDYAYARLLEERVTKLREKESLNAEDRAWLTRAGKALIVPEKVVKDLTTFTLNAERLEAWRNAMAALLE
jgi:hypothetical protein